MSRVMTKSDLSSSLPKEDGLGGKNHIGEEGHKPPNAISQESPTTTAPS